MKTINLSILSILFISIVACTNAPDSDKATTTDTKEVTPTENNNGWKIDPSVSNLKWVGTKISGYHVGNLKIKEGTMQVESGVLAGGKIALDMTSIAVNGPEGSNEEMNAKLQGHLLSADFFETDKYPVATFEITSAKPTTNTSVDENDPRQAEINEYKVTDPTHLISGNLTIKDISKNIEFPAKITVTDNTVEAIAKFNIDRTQWNIVYPGKPDDLIKNEVHIGLSIKANK
jgi:polyisoprenoid-binding protein YceI